MRPSKLSSSASIAQQVQVSLNFTSALYITVHTAVTAQLPVPWLLLCVRLLVLCDWSPEIPGRLKSCMRVSNVSSGYFEEGETEEVTATNRSLGCHAGLYRHRFVRMPPDLGVAVTRTCFGWSWAVMYFSEGQVLTCQLHF